MHQTNRSIERKYRLEFRSRLTLDIGIYEWIGIMDDVVCICVGMNAWMESESQRDRIGMRTRGTWPCCRWRVCECSMCVLHSWIANHLVVEREESWNDEETIMHIVRDRVKPKIVEIIITVVSFECAMHWKMPAISRTNVSSSTTTRDSKRNNKNNAFDSKRN